MSDEFECAFPVFKAHPDDMASWPAEGRTACLNAMDRLLDRNPGRKVIEEKSYCIDKTHPRFPADAKLPWPYFLVYQVRLSAPLQVVQ